MTIIPNNMTHIRLPRAQRGAVLIVSMLLLLTMTLLAMGASQSTRLQERMAGSLRNQDLAFQAAEAALRAGERFVEDQTKAPDLCSTMPCPAGQVYERGYLDAIVTYQNQAYQDRSWWTTNAKTYAATAQISGTELASAEPQYYIEEIEDVPDALSQPTGGPPPSRMYYRIVARGEGGTSSAQVVLHTTYARRFN